MQEINRAMEDNLLASAMVRKIAEQAMAQMPERPAYENREQRRARERAEKKAAKRTAKAF